MSAGPTSKNATTMCKVIIALEATASQMMTATKLSVLITTALPIRPKAVVFLTMGSDAVLRHVFKIETVLTRIATT